jgi:hypothetical protein
MWILLLTVALAAAAQPPTPPPDPDLAALDAKIGALTAGMKDAAATVAPSVQILCLVQFPESAEKQRVCRERQAKAMWTLAGRPDDDLKRTSLREATTTDPRFVDAHGQPIPLIDFERALRADLARR